MAEKVLVIDDDNDFVESIVNLLEARGYEVASASNGPDGVEKAKADKPDLILSDWHMPEMSGLALKEALNARNIDVPFGFITSENSDQMRRTAAAAGANFLLAKPFTPDDMASVLEAIVA